MAEELDESIGFMERLVATWLEAARDAEIVRVLDAIKAELGRRGIATGSTGGGSQWPVEGQAADRGLVDPEPRRSTRG